jgi:hypothetical protein
MKKKPLCRIFFNLETKLNDTKGISKSLITFRAKIHFSNIYI